MKYSKTLVLALAAGMPMACATVADEHDDGMDAFEQAAASCQNGVLAFDVCDYQPGKEWNPECFRVGTHDLSGTKLDRDISGLRVPAGYEAQLFDSPSSTKPFLTARRDSELCSSPNNDRARKIVVTGPQSPDAGITPDAGRETGSDAAPPQPPPDSIGGKTLARYTYAPQNRPYPRGIKASSRYRVMVKPASDKSAWNATSHVTATYEAWPDYPDADTIPASYKDVAVHLAQVDADTRLRFRVETVGLGISTVKLKPSRYGEMRSTQASGSNWVEFEIEPAKLTRHVLVEINEPTGSPVLNHGLMLFVNPPSVKPSGKVLELPAGVVDASHPAMDDNQRILIDDKSPYDALYVPANTIVDGRIEVKKRNFSILGRGMVVGSRWKWPKSNADWARNYPITPARDVVKGLVTNAGGTIEGIASIHPYHFNFVGGGISRNLKAFGWRHSTDGIHGVDVAEGCFSKVNDDHIYTPTRTIRNNTYWVMGNGSAFQHGWGGPGGGSDRKGGVVSQCDVSRSEYESDGGDRQNTGIFGSVDQSTADVSDIEYRDIRVDAQTCRFINFEMSPNRGTWSNFRFIDIWFENALGCPVGAGRASAPLDNYLTIGGSLQGFLFQNVTLGGKKLSSLQQLSPLKQQNVKADTFVFR